MRYRLLYLLIVALLLSSSSPLVVQADRRTPLPVYAGTREQAVQAAVRDQKGVSATAILEVGSIAELNGWTFGTVGVFADNELPNVYLYLAEQRTEGWAVAIEYTDLFRAALKHIPRDLLTPEQWATLDYNPATSLQSLIELQNDRSMQISLPWPVGESRYLTQGPHGAQSAALDFAGPANATVHAARGGVAYHACPGAADTHLRIDHGNGISTNYYHLDAITVGNGQAVARWEAVGRQGTKVRCQGYVTGAHFHFWITINGQNMPIDGFEFGGWHVSGNCMIRIRDATTRCASIYFTANNTITNEGAIGSGYSIGQGSGREPVFDQAYNRHGGARNLGYPAGLVVWWGNTNPVMIQEYDGGAFGPSLLVYDRNNDPDHLRGVPAYVLRGAFRQHYQSIGGPDSWLGVPTSDEYLNTEGKPQQSFRNGFLIYHGPGNIEARSWPAPQDGQWHVQFRNYVHDVWNFQMGPTWVENQSISSRSSCWVDNAPGSEPGAMRWGVWPDYFTVRWSGRFYFDEGVYRFRAAADDRVYIRVDGNLIIEDRDWGRVNEEYTADIRLSAGYHDVVVEFIEFWGQACTDFSWTKITPEPPSNLRQTGSTTNSVSIAWQDNSNNEDGFHIYWSDGSNWHRIASVGANVTSYTIPNLNCNGYFIYRITAYNGAGESPPSNQVETWSAACPTATPTPTATPRPTLTPTPTATARPTVTPTPQPTFLFMLYLNGDNNLSRYMQNAIRNLEALTLNSNVKVVALIDSNGRGDTRRLLVQKDGRYTPNVNSWSMGELNMGDAQTLQNFVQWALTTYPSQYSYLAIASHGNGIEGFSWDDSHNRDKLTPAEVRTALHNATNGGQRKIDIVHYDACSMALLEQAYDIRSYANYLIASQNLAWAVFAYNLYVPATQLSSGDATALAGLADAIAEISADTTPRTLAGRIATLYYNHRLINSKPRTVSVLDLSQVNSTRQALDTLANALRSNLSGVTTSMQNARSAVQKFDSREPLYRIDQDDEYIDLYHWADTLERYVQNATVQSAARQVKDVVKNRLVVVNYRASGVYNDIYIELDNAHGVSLYFPRRSGSNDYEQYLDHLRFQFTRDSSWDSLLADFFGVAALPPESPFNREVLPLLIPNEVVYVPLVVRGR